MEPRKSERDKPSSAGALGRWVALGIAASTFTGGVFFYLFAWQQRGPAWNFALEGLTGQQLFDSARTAVTLVGIVGLGGAAFLAFRRQRTTEETQLTALGSLNLSQNQFQHEAIRTLRERYTSAAEQLGSGSFAIRLAGVYAFASLADDWADAEYPAERQVCIDVLCAYLRTPATAANSSAGNLAGSVYPQTQDASGEAEVRSTIIRVIGHRTRMDAATEEDGPWQDCNFDLSGSELPHIRWPRSRFNGHLNFADATFKAGVDFSHSYLHNVNFDRAVFRGTTNSVRALFKSTRFFRAQFIGTKFNIDAVFTRMTNTGSVSFLLTEFQGPRTLFNGANFQKNTTSDFTDAKFDGKVVFSSCLWCGIVTLRNVDFDSVSQLSFWSPQKWDVPPTVDWTDHGEQPSSLQQPWPPTLSSKIRELAEQQGVNDKQTGQAPSEPSEATDGSHRAPDGPSNV